MKKIIFLIIAHFLFLSCGSKSLIITTKDKAIQNDIYAFKKVDPQITDKKLIVVEKEIIESNGESKTTIATDIKTEQLPETIDDEFIATSTINPSAVEQDTIQYEEDVNYNSSLSEKIANAALENIGIHYHTGGTNQSGFDCSGLMVASFSKYDVKLPRTSNEMSRFGKRINPKKAQKGDLIFFKTLGNRKINHVGMVIEVNEDEIKFVHASIKKGVIISTTKEGYYKSKFSQVNRVL
jgi:cell wall-associated NlpC family hydrolase